jgi:predicted Co/Zn/Cd cation transporter (cation efflux family)
MRDSLERLQRLCRTINRHDREWLIKLDATSWLRHISGSLSLVLSVVLTLSFSYTHPLILLLTV